MHILLQHFVLSSNVTNYEEYKLFNEKYHGHTSLSSFVSKISSCNDTQVVFDDKIIQNNLLNLENLQNDFKDIEESSIYVSNLAKHIHSNISSDCSKLIEANQDFLEKFHLEKINHLYSLHKESKIQSQKSFTLFSVFFERFLGDVFLNACKNKKMVPKLLRDLLETQELSSVLGKQIIYLLQAIIGPATGLNLRNIIWHGFITPREFNPCYTEFLFILYFSCLQVVKKSEIKDFKFRTLMTPKSEMVIDFGHGIDPLSLDHEFLSNVENILNSSYFVFPERSEYVFQAFKDFSQGKFWESLAVIVPQLEHSLRRIFILVNKQLPEEMLLAQSRVLFTTFDEILTLSIEGVPNYLIKELGESIFSCLNDLFIHADGLRIRDKVAHGETDQIDPLVLKKILGVYLFLSMKYNVRKSFENEPFKQMNSYFMSYHSIYHPKSCFILEDHELVEIKRKFSEIKFVDCRENVEFTCTWDSKAYTMKSNDKIGNSFVASHVEEFLKQIQLPQSLFCDLEGICENPICHFVQLGLKIEDYDFQDASRKEVLLLVGMMRKVVEEVKNIMTNFLEKIQFYEKMMRDRTARSNHRKVYTSMKQLHIFYLFIIRYILCRVESEFIAVSNGKEIDFKKDHKELQRLVTLGQRVQEDTSESYFGAAVHKFLVDVQFFK